MLGFILALIIGGLAGYIAGRLMNADFGVLVNILLGVAGAFVFNLILSLLGFGGDGNLIGQLVAGVVGACLLIWGYREFKRRN